jgi:hypothetical protein
MRALLVLIAIASVGCSSNGEARRAQQPAPRAEPADSDGFTNNEKEALSELLGVDVRSRPEDGAGPAEQPAPSASSSGRAPAEDLRPAP